MKKILASVLTLAMTTVLLSGCAGVPVAVDPMQQGVKEEVAEEEISESPAEEEPIITMDGEIK